MSTLRSILLLTLFFALTSLTPVAAMEPVVIPAQSAAELIDALGCRACHLLDKRGGNRGPALDGVGKRRDAAYLRLWLQWPQSLAKGTVMPAYDYLTPEQLETLLDFLQRLK